MAFFANTYRVLFHDTMAYGSHHHVTNIKFQNLARETFTFESFTKDGSGYKENLGNTVMLTRDAYSLNYAPVDLGVRVVTLVSSEAKSFSTVRLCFRTIREDGEPVSCGFQTIVLIDANTLNMVRAPELVTQFSDPDTPYNILEEGGERSFKDMLLQEPVQKKKIFSEEIISLAKHITSQPKSESFPRIYDKQFNTYPIDLSVRSELANAETYRTEPAAHTGSSLPLKQQSPNQQSTTSTTTQIEGRTEEKKYSGAIKLERGKPADSAAGHVSAEPSDQNSTVIRPAAKQRGDSLDGQRLNGTSRNGTLPKSAPPAADVASIKHEPIAIVGYGCVVPGASNVGEYWNSITKGIDGIVDSSIYSPDGMKNFLLAGDDGGIHITPDKTYTALTGLVRKINYSDAVARYFTEAEFNQLVKGQKMGLSAFVEAVENIDLTRYASDRLCFVIGSTADGQSEYDQTLLLNSLKSHLDTQNFDEAVKREFVAVSESVYGVSQNDERRLRQHNILNAVLEKIFSTVPDVVYVDTACSSSIYSIDIGIKALRDKESDIVFAGGLFAPGPANSPLFAQFGGLSPTDSTPLDAGANGVVFGEGAGFVVLKRLSDAIRDKDQIKAVIRGLGKSSDGKTPSINVPRPKGQLLSLKRAYGSEIRKESIQFVEAHATATSVGDTVEVDALSQFFSERHDSASRIQLQSVKSIIGHTGWVSGIASIIKVCLAMEHRTYPRQHKFSEPSPELKLESSPFHIAVDEQIWPENVDQLPRRAAINSFGFGGTNSHIVLEEYLVEYHAKVIGAVEPKKVHPKVAIVDLDVVSPDAKLSAIRSHADHSRFNRENLRLPDGKFLLPDVTDDMDVSQFLSSNAAGNIITRHADLIENIKDNLAVIIGFQSKTENGDKITQRILFGEFRSKLQSKIAESPELRAKEPLFAQILHSLEQSILDNTTASGPYTLPGLMPNLVSSRVNNLFDLKGHNLVIDSGASSFEDSVKVALQTLKYDSVDAVIVGEIQSHSRVDHYDGEFSMLMLLMNEDQLANYNAEPVAFLSLDEKATQTSRNNAMDFHRSFAEFQPAVTGKVTSVSGPFVLSAPMQDAAVDNTSVNNNSTNTAVSDDVKESVWKQLTSNEIKQYTPVFEPQVITPAAAVETSAKSVLLITDDRAVATDISDSLSAYKYYVLGPDLNLASNYTNSAALTESDLLSVFEKIGLEGFDHVVVAGLPRNKPRFITGNYEQEIHLTEVLFLICRSLHSALANGGPSISVLYTKHDSLEHNVPDAGYAALSGLLKSVKRERPAANISLVSFSGTDTKNAVTHLFKEIASEKPRYEEIYYHGGERRIKRLQEIESPAAGSISFDWLTSNSVVLATGGAKGVTATLVESILQKVGCTVIALGRTSMDDVPQHILKMTPEALSNYEAEFYKSEIKKDPKRKIVELKKQFQWYKSANEVRSNMDTLNKLPGRAVYMPTDISDADNLTAALADVCRDYGSIDLVVHGAGIQKSSDITKKSLADFRKIVDVKLQSLSTIYNFCHQNLDTPPRYNLLSSAFSYWGNDGQPDYGAANETLNALSSAMQEQHWTSIAWLGWAGIGMTSGSEYAALAVNRGLRGIRKHEGQEIFWDSVARVTPVTPAVTMSIGEQEFYQPEVSDSSYSTSSQVALGVGQSGEKVCHYNISTDTVPLLENHTVRGVPVLPAAFLTCMVGESAKQYRPDLYIQSFLETEFIQFVKLDGRGIRELRVCIHPVQENGRSVILDIELRSDFYHRSGVILESDVLHTKTRLVMGEEILKPDVGEHKVPNDFQGISLQDPYVMPGAPVELGADFDCMYDIRVGDNDRITNYRLNSVSAHGKYSYFEPLVYLLDTNWRFSTIQNTLGDPEVYVPRRCSNMKVFFDFTDFGSELLKRPLSFFGENPTPNGRELSVGPITVVDDRSHSVISFIGGECLSMGTVQRRVPENAARAALSTQGS